MNSLYFFWGSYTDPLTKKICFHWESCSTLKFNFWNSDFHRINLVLHEKNHLLCDSAVPLILTTSPRAGRARATRRARPSPARRTDDISTPVAPPATDDISTPVAPPATVHPPHVIANGAARPHGEWGQKRDRGSPSAGARYRASWAISAFRVTSSSQSEPY